MARTKKSRGGTPFELKSGNSPMQGKFWDFAKKAIAGPTGMIVDALKGGGGPGGGVPGAAATAGGIKGALENTKMGKVHKALHSGEGGGGDPTEEIVEELDEGTQLN